MASRTPNYECQIFFLKQNNFLNPNNSNFPHSLAEGGREGTVPKLLTVICDSASPSTQLSQQPREAERDEMAMVQQRRSLCLGAQTLQSGSI